MCTPQKNKYMKYAGEFMKDRHRGETIGLAGRRRYWFTCFHAISEYTELFSGSGR